MKDPTVAIIIVNYKTGRLAAECLASIFRLLDSDSLRVHVYLVDNASGDSSVQQLSAFISKFSLTEAVTLIEAEYNGGYAYGNNLAIRMALGSDEKFDFFWLLNPDTMVRPGAAGYLIQALSEDETRGIVGSRLEDSQGVPQVSAFRWPTPIGEFVEYLSLGWLNAAIPTSVVPMIVSDTSHRADWVAGASMMCKRQLIEQVGLMDEEYFLYYEEVDYCRAANETGWQTWYVPASRVVHYVGAATGISDTRRKPVRRPRYWFESRARYFTKHYGWIGSKQADLFALSGYLLGRLKDLLLRKPDSGVPYFARDLIRYLLGAA